MTLEREAQAAADHWGGASLTLIRNRENAVFRMILPGGGHAALRLHRTGYQSAAAIGSELWWCTALADAALPVPRAIPARNGESLIRLADGRLASAVTWLAGSPMGEAGVPLAGSCESQTALHHKLGQLIARMHSATDTLSLPASFIRPSWDIDGLAGETPFWGRFWDHPALTGAERAEMRAARSYLHGSLKAHASNVAMGPIHADVLRENVLVNDRSLSLIDFDDSGIGFRLYDLGTVLSQNLSEPHYHDIRAALMDGYGTSDTQAVDLFTMARTLASVGWTMPRLAPDDPIMRRHIDRALACARNVMG